MAIGSVITAIAFLGTILYTGFLFMPHKFPAETTSILQEAKENSHKFDSREDALYWYYSKAILPFEVTYMYPEFNETTTWTKHDFQAIPQVLLLGPYSVGKTTFISSFVKGECPGMNIGPEPTTDKFNIYYYSQDPHVVYGNALIVSNKFAYGGLSKFGAAFLDQVVGVGCRRSVLETLTFVDSPGILSGLKQSIGRAYDFPQVSEWFASRSDLIIIMFDAHKLDLSDEMVQVIQHLFPYRNKFRILLNKAQDLTTEQLLRVYGALMWNLARVFDSPEVVKVEIGNFDFDARISKKNELGPVFEESRSNLKSELLQLPQHTHARKLDDLVRRTRRIRIHVQILDRIRKFLHSQSSMFGRLDINDAKNLLTETKIKQIFREVQSRSGHFSADFPTTSKFRKTLFARMEKVLQLPLDDLEAKLKPLDAVIEDGLPDLYQAQGSDSNLNDQS